MTMADPNAIDDPDETEEISDPISHARGLIALQEIDELHEGALSALGAPMGSESSSSEDLAIDVTEWPELRPRSLRV